MKLVVCISIFILSNICIFSVNAVVGVLHNCAVRGLEGRSSSIRDMGGVECDCPGPRKYILSFGILCKSHHLYTCII